MANTLVATPEGLEMVDKARKRLSWNKTAKAWLDKAEISKATLDRFWAGKGIKYDSFVSICDAIGINWENIVDRGKAKPIISGIVSPSFHVSRKLKTLASQMEDWFGALRYQVDSCNESTDIYFEWLIRVPSRRGYIRVVVQGSNDEIGVNHLRELKDSVARQNADEGWLVTNFRISPSVRKVLETSHGSSSNLFCFTFDELVDQDADFSPYIEWLEKKVATMKIDENYISLSCTKEKLDREESEIQYDDIDLYINEWLVKDRSEHISIIGEFGTGKTWFAFHYAWECLKRYRQEINRGYNRTRLPLLITLKDYSKANDIDNVLAGFFYSKHNIRLNKDVFNVLNKWGKILIIFDGFDEMTNKIDSQIIANNFAELAKIVVPGSKIILTSRSECFPSSDFRNAVFSGKVSASTLISHQGESLKFETLKLALFTEKQVRQLLSLQHIDISNVDRILRNRHLLDLFKRPIMIDLVSEALFEIERIEKLETLDLARVYLYAVKNKLEREIKEERTFTSLADKLYFMCEVSWEMLSTDRSSLNYRDFPLHLGRLFGQKVQESYDLDHWHYDMMRTSILIRDNEGNYTPAHRSLLEFFVAYKFAAELGLLKDDFIDICRSRKDTQLEPSQLYTWSEYWQRSSDGHEIPYLTQFKQESLENLGNTFGKYPLTLFSQILIDLLTNIISSDSKKLLTFILDSRENRGLEVDFIVGNITTVLINRSRDILKELDLSNTILRGANLQNAYLINSNFKEANLDKVIFAKYLGEAVYSATFSPDLKWLVTGSEDGVIRLWSVDSAYDWQEKFVLMDAHSRCHITALAWSPRIDKIVSGDEHGKLKIWDFNQRQGNISEIPQQLQGHTERIRAISFSPDEKYIASGGTSREIKIWNVESNILLKTLSGHESTVRSIAWNSDSTQIASGSRDKTIKIWDVETTDVIKILEHESWVRAVLWHDNIIVSAGDDNKIKIWDTITDNFEVLGEHDDIIRTIAFSPDCRKVLSGSDDTTLKVWDITTKKHLRTYIDHKDSIKTVAWSPDGQHLYSSSSDKTVKVWEASTGYCISTLPDTWGSIGTHASIINPSSELIDSCNFTVFGDEATLKSITWSPDGTKIATASRDTTLKIWNVDTGECLAVLFGHKSTVRAVAWSPDGKKILSGSRDKTLKIWDALKFEEITLQIDPSDEWIRAVAWSPDSKKIVSSGDDCNCTTWDAETGDRLQIFVGHKKPVRAVAWSPDGTKLLSASDDKTLKIWDAETANCIQSLCNHKNWVRGAMWNPDGTKIVSTGRDRSILVWDAMTGKCLFAFPEKHQSAIRSVAWSPNDKYIVSGSDDYTINVWDVYKKELIQFKEQLKHGHYVTTVAWSPDSTKFASGSRDKKVKIWDINTGTCLLTLSNQIYGGMNIKDAIGLTSSQIENLKSLGAVDMMPSNNTATDSEAKH
jgi:WD40 repeat protein/DNA-binding Xre family transcriptional regulator